ncbi:MAG: DUF4124 domain-containing protein [Myxococcaceae bacterium]
MTLASLPLSVICAVIAQSSGVYRWVDKDGQEHFTNEKPPASAREINLDGAAVTSIHVDPKARKAPSPPSLPVFEATVVSEASAEKLNEEAWRERFRRAHARVRTAEVMLADERRRRDEVPIAYFSPWACPQLSPMMLNPRGPYSVPPGCAGFPVVGRDELDRRVLLAQRELEDAQQALHELERAASFRAVPREWRR